MIRPQPKSTPRKPPMKQWQHRRKNIKQRSKTRVRVVDVERRDWCREQPCIARVGFGRCGGPIDPHHAGKKPGAGMKSPEDTTVPICRRHHDQIQGTVGGFGVFQALGEVGRRELQNDWIADATARYRAHGGRRGR